MSDLHALLIGVDFYFEHRLPDGSFYPKLGGCVRDIHKVETFLTERLHLPPERLLKLTATNTDGAQPAEPHDQWPTYSNMVYAFKRLIDMTRSGDQVYIQYSGHGGRAVTVYKELKGIDGVDETLVPLDIGDPQARYLRDVELYYLFQTMVDKGLIVTVVFDSCHSGGATRGIGGAVARGIGRIDNMPRPVDSLVASPQALAATWERVVGATRSAKADISWLLEPKGYTLLAACRPSESAYEYPFDGRESNGALTYWLLDTLNNGGTSLSWKMVHDRVLAKVHSQFERQSPMLQGEGDRIVFGDQRIQPHYTVPVLEVESTSKRVLLNAGEVQGLTAGAQFAIYPYGTMDFERIEQRIAVVELAQVGAVESWATVREQTGGATIEPGALGIPISGTNLRLQRGIRVVIEDTPLRQQMEVAIQANGKGFLALANEGNRVDVQVAINDQQEYELWDPAGEPIPNLRPAISVGEVNALSRVVQRLVHLAQYRNVQELDVPNENMRKHLTVELVATPVNRPGDRVVLRITNNQSPGAANDATRILNITVLDLSSDWSITQVYPAGAGKFEPIDPGQTIELPFTAVVNEGQTESLDILKVFATRATTEFRWLELPALDNPMRTKVTRSAGLDPLERLLASITAAENVTHTRAVLLTASPQQDIGWTVAQVELRVQA